MKGQELYNPKRNRGSGNIGAANVGKSIDFLLQFSFCLYTNSERNRWAKHILIPSFVARSISSSSDTCVACTEGNCIFLVDFSPLYQDLID